MYNVKRTQVANCVITKYLRATDITVVETSSLSLVIAEAETVAYWLCAKREEIKCNKQLGLAIEIENGKWGHEMRNILYNFGFPFLLTGNGEASWCFSQIKGALDDDVTDADIISCVEFNHDGELLATGDKGGRVVIFQVKTKQFFLFIYRTNNNPWLCFWFVAWSRLEKRQSKKRRI